MSVYAHALRVIARQAAEIRRLKRDLATVEMALREVCACQRKGVG